MELNAQSSSLSMAPVSLSIYVLPLNILCHTTYINALTLTTKKTRKVSITVAGQTPLHIACCRVPPCLEMVQLLLQQGADTNIAYSKGSLSTKLSQYFLFVFAVLRFVHYYTLNYNSNSVAFISTIACPNSPSLQ